MGTLAVAAALAVCVGALMAVLASRARGLTAGIVVAGVGALLVEGTIPTPVSAAFSGVAVVLAAYLVAVSARDGKGARGGWSGAAFIVVGMVGGIVLAPGAWHVGAAAGAAIAASVVLLWQGGGGPSVASGAVLGLIGARLVAGELGLALGSLGEGALDLAIVGAGGSAITGRVRTPARWAAVEPAVVTPVLVEPEAVEADDAVEPEPVEPEAIEPEAVEPEASETEVAAKPPSRRRRQAVPAEPKPSDEPADEPGPTPDEALPAPRRPRKPRASDPRPTTPEGPATPEPAPDASPRPGPARRRRGSPSDTA